MPKRYLRMSPEFLEDILEYSKDPEWTEKVLDGTFKITVDIENDADQRRRDVPIKVHREPMTNTLVVEWDVSVEEDAFERFVFEHFQVK